MKLTSRLHKLASRLQVTYHDLVTYLSQNASSIAEQAQNLEVDHSEEMGVELGITARRSVSNWERTRTHNQKEAKGPI